MEKILKVAVGGVKEFDEDQRTITAYASTIDKDRQGDNIPVEAWKLDNYNKNPVILWAHDYSAPPVAKALWTKTDKRGLLQKIQFAKTDFASDIFNLMKDGFLNAFSVGFMGDRNKDDQATFASAELLEVSVVPVPANAGALAERAAKGFKSQLAGMIVKSMLSDLGATEEDKAAIQAKEAAAKKEEEDKTTKDAASDNWTKEKDFLLAELARLKTGRVLSSNNKTLIEDCVGIMKDAIGKLEALLEAPEEDPGEEDPAAEEEGKQLDNAQKSIIIKTKEDPKAKDISAEDFKAISQDIKAGIAEAVRKEMDRLKGIV